MEDLKEYHYAWLEAHPWRTKEWLLERLTDGFHIHHIDGDRHDNSSKNLILIEGSDHMHLHGMPLRDMARKANTSKCYGPTKAQIRRLKALLWYRKQRTSGHDT